MKKVIFNIAMLCAFSAALTVAAKAQSMGEIKEQALFDIAIKKGAGLGKVSRDKDGVVSIDMGDVLRIGPVVEPKERYGVVVFVNSAAFKDSGYILAKPAFTMKLLQAINFYESKSGRALPDVAAAELRIVTSEELEKELKRPNAPGEKFLTQMLKALKEHSAVVYVQPVTGFKS